MSIRECKASLLKLTNNSKKDRNLFDEARILFVGSSTDSEKISNSISPERNIKISKVADEPVETQIDGYQQKSSLDQLGY